MGVEKSMEGCIGVQLGMALDREVHVPTQRDSTHSVFGGPGG